MGQRRGHQALCRPHLCQQRHSHPDGAADHEQPTQGPENGAEQKRTGGRRLRQRQDAVFHKTQPHAASQFLRCHRSEGLDFKNTEKIGH